MEDPMKLKASPAHSNRYMENMLSSSVKISVEVKKKGHVANLKIGVGSKAVRKGTDIILVHTIVVHHNLDQ